MFNKQNRVMQNGEMQNGEMQNRVKQNRIKQICLAVILLIIFTILPPPAAVNAEVSAEAIKNSSVVLVKLKVLQGDAKGNLNLNNKIKRSEFFTLVVRMLGYDREKNDSATTPDALSFTDISPKHWSYNYFVAAYRHGLVKGYTDGTVKPDKYVTYAEALTVILRALGYNKELSAGEWPASALLLAKEKAIDKEVVLPKDKQLTRGETSVIIYNSLTVSFNQ
ncbi:MAG: S-layer homology domain-containing protein [Clostridiales bacterium]|nr:S-layer homology domain-containing protein [Clostridiales bacterium]